MNERVTSDPPETISEVQVSYFDFSASLPKDTIFEMPPSDPRFGM